MSSPFFEGNALDGLGETSVTYVIAGKKLVLIISDFSYLILVIIF